MLRKVPIIGIKYFYPRSPCGERPHIQRSRKQHHPFLSTLSLRRATTSSTVIVILRKNFYPRSPCGERHVRCFSPAGCWRISIHALLAESDQAANGLANAPPQISIHALLAESDKLTACQNGLLLDFYPRSPCGERQAANGLADTPPKISIHALLAESD